MIINDLYQYLLFLMSNSDVAGAGAGAGAGSSADVPTGQLITGKGLVNCRHKTPDKGRPFCLIDIPMCDVSIETDIHGETYRLFEQHVRVDKRGDGRVERMSPYHYTASFYSDDSSIAFYYKVRIYFNPHSQCVVKKIALDSGAVTELVDPDAADIALFLSLGNAAINDIIIPLQATLLAQKHSLCKTYEEQDQIALALSMGDVTSTYLAALGKCAETLDTLRHLDSTGFYRARYAATRRLMDACSTLLAASGVMPDSDTPSEGTLPSLVDSLTPAKPKLNRLPAKNIDADIDALMVTWDSLRERCQDLDAAPLESADAISIAMGMFVPEDATLLSLKACAEFYPDIESNILLLENREATASAKALQTLYRLQADIKKHSINLIERSLSRFKEEYYPWLDALQRLCDISLDSKYLSIALRKKSPQLLAFVLKYRNFDIDSTSIRIREGEDSPSCHPVTWCFVSDDALTCLRGLMEYGADLFVLEEDGLPDILHIFTYDIADKSIADRYERIKTSVVEFFNDVGRLKIAFKQSIDTLGYDPTASDALMKKVAESLSKYNKPSIPSDVSTRLKRELYHNQALLTQAVNGYAPDICDEVLAAPAIQLLICKINEISVALSADQRKERALSAQARLANRSYKKYYDYLTKAPDLRKEDILKSVKQFLQELLTVLEAKLWLENIKKKGSQVAPHGGKSGRSAKRHQKQIQTEAKLKQQICLDFARRYSALSLEEVAVDDVSDWVPIEKAAAIFADDKAAQMWDTVAGRFSVSMPGVSFFVQRRRDPEGKEEYLYDITDDPLCSGSAPK